MKTLNVKYRKRVSPLRPNRLGGLIFLSVLIALIYAPVLAGHASLKTNNIWPSGPLFVGDPTAGGYITVPLERLVAEAWSHFQIPMIDPFQGFAIPLISSQGVSVFFPEILTHLLLPNQYSIWNLIRLDALAYGTFLLAFSLDFSFAASLAAGAVAALAGVASPEANLGMLNPLMVLPFVLLALRYVLDPGYKRVFAAWLGFLTAVFLLALSGFQEVLPLIFVLVVIFAIGFSLYFKVIQRRPRRLLGAGIAGMLALVFGASGYLPTLTIVKAGFGVNNAQSYLSRFPSYMLGGLTIPKLTGPSLVALAAHPSKSQDLWILGSPFLVLVLILAIVAVWRHDRCKFWIVTPGVALVLVGILGFSDELGIAKIFSVFPFDLIVMSRFLGFMWWIPWCLLLAFVISTAGQFSRLELVLSAALSLAVDLVLYRNFVDANKLTQFLEAGTQPIHALISSVLFLLFFSGALYFSFRIWGSWLAVAVVLFATVTAVPTNFFPRGSSKQATSLTGDVLPPSRSLVDFSGFLQLPSQVTSVNLFGPLMPPAYVSLVDKAFPSAYNLGHSSATAFPAPTLYFVPVTPQFFGILRTFGVNEFVSASKLSAGSEIPDCSSGHSGNVQICYLGPTQVLGGSIEKGGFAYQLPGVDPLVFPAKKLLVSRSQSQALSNTLQLMDYTTGLPTAVSIVGLSNSHATLATNPQGINREVSTEAVTARIHADSAGLIVMRNSYLPGMSCAANGRRTKCMSVDGGLWTAVYVPRGSSTVNLNYVGFSTRLEIVLTLIGIFGIGLAWLALLLSVKDLKPRRSNRIFRRGRFETIKSGQPDDTVFDPSLDLPAQS